MSNRQANGDFTRVVESLEKLVAVLPITQDGMVSCAAANNGYQLLKALIGTV